MPMTPMELVAQARAQIKEISAQEAAAQLAKLTVLDVREPTEFEAGRIPGAINIPRGVLEFRIGEVHEFAKKDVPVVIYCRTGGRAALAAVALGQLGYSNVVSITGGIAAWEQSSLPVDKDRTQFY